MTSEDFDNLITVLERIAAALEAGNLDRIIMDDPKPLPTFPFSPNRIYPAGPNPTPGPAGPWPHYVPYPPNTWRGGGCNACRESGVCSCTMNDPVITYSVTTSSTIPNSSCSYTLFTINPRENREDKKD
jgi:hypothetical protein